MSANSDRVQSVDRAARLLQCFVDGPAEQTLTELARATGLQISTAHRLLRTLTGTGLLYHDRPRELYTYGPSLTQLARVALSRAGLNDAADRLQKLARVTGESTSLTIPAGAMGETLLFVESEEPLRFGERGRVRFPLHASGAGKAFLAFGERPPRDAVAELEPLKQYTDRTLSADALIADLEVTAVRGYSLADGEHYPGVRSLSVPIYDAARVLRAAVTVMGPQSRFTDDKLQSAAAAASEAADDLAALLVLPALS